MIKIKKGLDLPIEGEPRQQIGDGLPVRTLAIMGPDYVGVKPTMAVQVGDQVKLGQELFSDKKNPGVLYTAPGSGKVVAINRGEKRVLQSVVIQLAGSDELTFARYPSSQLKSLEREQVVENLVSSGLWTALRTRPFSKVPSPNAKPASIFVTAMDTNPLAPYPALIIRRHLEDFQWGLVVLSRLCTGRVYLCQDAAAKLAAPSDAGQQIESHIFKGPHPAGLVGTHIHFLDPVSDKKTVWHVGYQDVIAMGKLFATGRLWTERYIALAGPAVKDPQLVKTRLGASVTDLLAGQVKEGDWRAISGSVLSGRIAAGAYAYLGRYDNQISVLFEGRQREFLGWQLPGFHKFSVKNVFASAMLPWYKFAFNTSTNGSVRAMVPIGSYEAVMPLDIEATFLLRSLLIQDSEQAALLGALELDEEDLGLCTFACPGKVEYGPLLRSVLNVIEKEG